MAENVAAIETPAVKTIKDNTAVASDRAPQRKTIRDAFIVSLVLISFCILNSPYARAVCNVCTVIPACVFSYAQLYDSSTRLFAYKATLFYWTMNGILIAGDTMFAKSTGYFFGKFLLLTILFLNIVYQQQVSKRLNERRQQKANVTASDTSLSTAFTITDAVTLSAPVKRKVWTHSVGTLSSSSVHSIDITAFSDADFIDGDSSLNTLDSTKEDVKQLISGDEHEESSLRITTTTNTSVENNDTMGSTDAERELNFRFTNGISKTDDDVALVQQSSITQVQLIIDDSGNLVTKPNENLTLKRPFTHPVAVSITNNFTSSIAWALRTNAVERLMAEPTSGVLPAGAMTKFMVGLEKAPPTDISISDKIAIDYSAVDKSITTFDRGLLRDTEPGYKRKRINVHYED
ncbi:hypothetical protein Tcan_03489 [Toxocara canis]|uniref:Major sperm protein n=1 Tax=Toxocara canis TaxID=6265 RepID=A0A0B2VJB1_TOXCA|nr:hypothetical protein Tcan_03489 [Toxocara canis]